MNQSTSKLPIPARFFAYIRYTAGKRNWAYMAAPVIGAVAGLLAGMIPIVLAGFNPFFAYKALFEGAFGGNRQLTETILKATPLLIMGLAMSVAFRAKVWNIGGEGQFFLGALFGGMAAIALQDKLPGAVVIPIMLLMGALGGAIWALIPAYLKVKLEINEVVVTLMLNYIAIYLVSYLTRAPFKDPASFLPQSKQLIESVHLPTMFGTRIHIGVILALILVPVIQILMMKTPLGFRLRAIGDSKNAARSVGINIALGTLLTMAISGALAGLCGIIEVSTLNFRISNKISGGYGWTAIVIALMGREQPVGVLIASVFFAALYIGAGSMHVAFGLPSALADFIQGLVILFVITADAIVRLKKKA
jgi:ABC-type uncharacterized transport system permease subunit